LAIFLTLAMAPLVAGASLKILEDFTTSFSIAAAQSPGKPPRASKLQKATCSFLLNFSTAFFKSAIVTSKKGRAPLTSIK